MIHLHTVKCFNAVGLYFEILHFAGSLFKSLRVCGFILLGFATGVTIVAFMYNFIRCLCSICYYMLELIFTYLCLFVKPGWFVVRRLYGLLHGWVIVGLKFKFELGCYCFTGLLVGHTVSGWFEFYFCCYGSYSIRMLVEFASIQTALGGHVCYCVALIVLLGFGALVCTLIDLWLFNLSCKAKCGSVGQHGLVFFFCDCYLLSVLDCMRGCGSCVYTVCVWFFWIVLVCFLFVLIIILPFALCLCNAWHVVNHFACAYCIRALVVLYCDVQLVCARSLLLVAWIWVCFVIVGLVVHWIFTLALFCIMACRFWTLMFWWLAFDRLFCLSLHTFEVLVRVGGICFVFAIGFHFGLSCYDVLILFICCFRMLLGLGTDICWFTMCGLLDYQCIIPYLCCVLWRVLCDASLECCRMVASWVGRFGVWFLGVRFPDGLLGGWLLGCFVTIWVSGTLIYLWFCLARVGEWVLVGWVSMVVVCLVGLDSSLDCLAVELLELGFWGFYLACPCGVGRVHSLEICADSDLPKRFASGCCRDMSLKMACGHGQGMCFGPGFWAKFGGFLEVTWVRRVGLGLCATSVLPRCVVGLNDCGVSLAVEVLGLGFWVDFGYCDSQVVFWVIDVRLWDGRAHSLEI
eukprot:gene13073-8919_t